MARGRDELLWNHTAAVLAQIFNVNRDPDRTQAVDLMDFYPWPREQKSFPPPTEGDRQALRLAFPKN